MFILLVSFFITFKNLNIYGISKTIIFSVLHERINRETAIITQHVVNVFVELVNMPIFLLHIYFDHAHKYEYSIIFKYYHSYSISFPYNDTQILFRE